MKEAETRLKLFTEINVGQMRMKLKGNSFSRNLERSVRLEIGWKLLRLLGSASGFLSVGVTTSVLRGEGGLGYVCDEKGQRRSSSFDKNSRKGVELAGEGAYCCLPCQRSSVEPGHSCVITHSRSLLPSVH